MRKTIRPSDKPRMLELLAEAKRRRAYYVERLADGAMKEDDFQIACDNLARMVIAEAAITSLEVMK